MISTHTYSHEWIQEIQAGLGKKTDTKLLEKVIYALSLLERLQFNGLDLVFKGGTSLLLTMKQPVRFSIDIDIITQATPEIIEQVLSSIVTEGLFSRWEADKNRRHSADAPFLHYKVYYKSSVDNHFGEEPVLLDIMTTVSPYPKVNDQPIQHDWLHQEGEPLNVKVPAFECILGDKLTAFAPTTTGILYTKQRPVEIMKQLHDIGLLFDIAADLELIRQSYLQVVKEELNYRKLELLPADVLRDTFDTCLVLTSRNSAHTGYQQLQTGLNNITNFIITRFRIEEAITAAAKTAYLCGLLNKEVAGIPERFQSPEQVRDIFISHVDYQWLNKQKKTNPEAFFYWEKAIALKTG
ncbi:MAG: nucleotidyl transferase AbiEii/AbiGii toxin family protein [Bacteroidia bacterium]|nr:nucleotidyl transferase AbiEii/AbiGii toxin family protein [Bacteroidia bacterium]